MANVTQRIADIADRALAGLPPSSAEIEAILSIDDPDLAAAVFAAARELREQRFGDSIFLYGFVYFSTYCRNDCAFCLYRKGNPESPRYRKSPDEIVAVAADLAASGVHLIDLTMGEDPQIFDHGDFEPIVDLVDAVRRETGLPVMISPGVVPGDVLRRLGDAGADWYACYQETHVRAAYEHLRLGQSFDRRAAARSAAARHGMLVEDGLLFGTGESVAERAVSIDAMRDEATDQVRVMTFVPQRGTPMADCERASAFSELLAIATLRLTMPDRLIPASLDVDGIHGLEPRILAGANVVTSIVPPQSGLAGVGQAELDIDEGLRTVAEVSARLGDMDLHAAVPAEYAEWVDRARSRARRRTA